MSGKLDQSLDDILSTRRKAGGRRGRGRRVPNGGRVTAAVPVGGIQKSAKTGRGIPKAAPNGPAVGSGDSKIIVSNLPADVNEVQIKEYFAKSIGPVKKAMLTYGPNGISRGIATIIFNKASSANDALIQLNGMKVDNRPMRVEIVVNASAAVAANPSKGLGDRVSHAKNGKNQPRSAAAKPAAERGANDGRGRGRGARRGRNAGRPKAKTADELDTEMADYFEKPAAGAADATTNGAAPATNGGDEITMDEIS